MLTLLTFGWLFAWTGSAPTQEDVRAILQKAVQAKGKADQADKYRAARFKSKGTVYQVEGATFTDDEIRQDFDKVKSAQVINFNGQKISITMGFDGHKAWMKADGSPIDESELNLTAHIMNELYLSRVTNLTALLKSAAQKVPPADADSQKIAQLIHLLGDSSFAAREKASKDLVALGESAIPFLQKAQKSPDLEVARRSQRCLAIICGKDMLFDLSALPEIQVEGKAAVGVRVRSRGHKDINLYFDKKTYLLVKVQRRMDDQISPEEVNEERFLTEYQDVQGIKTPKKCVVFRDGKKYLDMEVVEAKYLEKVDDREFVKP
jgi:hypothetical protein